MILTINGKQAALKKGSSIEYVSENRIFTDADDYSMEIELPLADCPQNLDIFANTINTTEWQNKELKWLDVRHTGHQHDFVSEDGSYIFIGYSAPIEKKSLSLPLYVLRDWQDILVNKDNILLFIWKIGTLLLNQQGCVVALAA